MTELFLLGAGASAEADIPGTYAMTEKMLEKFKDDKRHKRIYKILEFVVGGLHFYKGIHGENPYEGVSIEDLFNTIMMLAERKYSELGPFISSWHPELGGLESGELTRSNASDLLQALYEPIENYIQNELTGAKLLSQSSFMRITELNSYINTDNLKKAFGESVHQVMIGGEGKLFKSASEVMLQKLIEMVWISDSSTISYLFPLLNYANENQSCIATLNYDNSIELAANVLDIAIDIGLETWSKSGDFKFDSAKLPLLKLHGSIDWLLSRGKLSSDKPLPYEIISKVNPLDRKTQIDSPAVIFGEK